MSSISRVIQTAMDQNLIGDELVDYVVSMTQKDRDKVRREYEKTLMSKIERFTAVVDRIKHVVKEAF